MCEYNLGPEDIFSRYDYKQPRQFSIPVTSGRPEYGWRIKTEVNPPCLFSKATYSSYRMDQFFIVVLLLDI
jgi:hypothetical protein